MPDVEKLTGFPQYFVILELQRQRSCGIVHPVTCLKEELYHMDRPATNTDELRSLFKKQKIATLDKLKLAIGTTSTMTVFRRLKELGYRTSYSHRGRFYTLADTPQFDNDGLWGYQSVGFSRYGNLLQTTQQFVDQAAVGFTSAELRSLLHVEVKQSLLQLVRQKQLRREKIGRHFVYLARAKEQRTRQKQQRKEFQASWEIGVSPLREELSQELNAAIILFYSLLDEKQRRLYAGLESFKMGHGGDQKIAEFLGLDVHAVARGRRELFRGDVQQERVRKKGAGRKAVEKNAASDRCDRTVVGTRHGRRSDQRFEVDAENDRKGCRTIEAVEDRRESEHGGAVVERHGVLVAG